MSTYTVYLCPKESHFSSGATVVVLLAHVLTYVRRRPKSWWPCSLHKKIKFNNIRFLNFFSVGLVFDFYFLILSSKPVKNSTHSKTLLASVVLPVHRHPLQYSHVCARANHFGSVLNAVANVFHHCFPFYWAVACKMISLFFYSITIK